MNVCFKTFGCRLNKAEALQQEADYIARGWEVTNDHNKADLFVVRGCSVTARAQHECELLIARLRILHPTARIRIEGCLDNRSPNERKKSGDATPTRTSRAYLKVQDGCNGKCTFCIVPKFRGKSASVPFEKLVDKTRRFIDAGYHEIVVTGCSLTLYASEGKRLPDLVAALAAAAGPEARIRLGSVEPGACAMETVQAMAECQNVCRFLHTPVQSGSDRILRDMRRPYVVKDIDALVTAAAKLMPSACIGCDVMTGFPGETELDFQATRSMLQRLPFVNAHVFPFSERPGTLAATMRRSVDKRIRSVRAHRIANLMDDKHVMFAKKFVGRTVEVVVESDDSCSGWTGEYLYCHSVSHAPRKSLVKMIVTKAHHDATLDGRPLPS